MSTYHPRVHFRGLRRYELGFVLSRRARRSVRKTVRYRRFLRKAQKPNKVQKTTKARKTNKARKLSRVQKANKARKAKKLPPAKPFSQPRTERLVAAIQKAQAMDSATLTQKFFNKLTFSSTRQQDAAKALFLTRLQTAHFKLCSVNRLVSKTRRRSLGAAEMERLALKATRFTNDKRRELGL
jgi:hypothetical protein